MKTTSAPGRLKHLMRVSCSKKIVKGKVLKLKAWKAVRLEMLTELKALNPIPRL